jgi:hypothetical protein
MRCVCAGIGADRFERRSLAMCAAQSSPGRQGTAIGATRSPPTERLGVDGHTVRKWVGRRPTPLYEPISVVSVVGRTCVGSTFVRPT